mgnify:CR=1 FL=1
MPLLSIRTETHGDIDLPSRRLTERCIESLGSPDGSTFLVLKGSVDRFVQAAGSRGRYVLESRDSYGEGFRHLRAGVPRGRKTTIHFRHWCPQGIHESPGCPLEIDEGSVLSLAAVKEALRHYAATGERHPGFHWDDVTDEHLEAPPTGVEFEEIEDIRPRGIHP